MDRCASAAMAGGGQRTDNQYITGTPALFHICEEESPNTLPGDGPGRQTWSVALRLHSPCRAHHRGVWAAQPREKSKSPATSSPLQRPEPPAGTRAPRRELSSSLPLQHSPSCPLWCFDVPAAEPALAQDGAAAVAPLLPPVHPLSVSACHSQPTIRLILLQATISLANAHSQPWGSPCPSFDQILLTGSPAHGPVPQLGSHSFLPPGTVPATIPRFPPVQLQQHGASTPHDSIGLAR